MFQTLIVYMREQRIQKLIKSIKSQQFLADHYKNHASSFEEIHNKLKETEQKHDELLSQCLSLLQLLSYTINQNCEEYDDLAEELEKQKIQRKTEAKQFQKNLDVLGEKLHELKTLIIDRQEQIAQLKIIIEEKDGFISQLEAQTRENTKILTEDYNKRFQQQLAAAKQNILNEANSETIELKDQLVRVQQENRILFSENELLANRLQSMIEHVKELQIEQNFKNEVSDEIICPLSQKSIEKSILSKRELIPKKRSEYLIKQDLIKEDKSQYGSSSSINRLILRQILNSQDRKSNSYGTIHFTKERINILTPKASEGNKFNKVKFGNKVKQKSIQIQISKSLQQFNTFDHSYKPMNPYYVFFILICQCAKINSGNLQAAFKVDLSNEWNKFIDKKIPYHDWYSCLLEKIKAQCPTNQ